MCMYICVYYYACPDFFQIWDMNALCVSSAHLNVLKGEVNLQFFKMLLKKRKKYSLRSKFLVFEKTGFLYFNKLA